MFWRWRKICVEYRYLIDWPHGPYGYIPWTHTERECGCTYNRGRGKKEVRIDLERSWKRARQRARRRHVNQFEMFMAELVDDVVHETAHAFEPPWTRWYKGENGAQLFAKYGRWTRQ